MPIHQCLGDCVNELLLEGFSIRTAGWLVLMALVVTQADWWTLDQQLPACTFDAVICTGLSFYQCYTAKGFVSALQCWGKLLKDGGVVLVDYMNQDEEYSKLRDVKYVTPNAPVWQCNKLTSSSGRPYVITNL